MYSSNVEVPHKVCVRNYLENFTLLWQTPSTGTDRDPISFKRYHTKDKKPTDVLVGAEENYTFLLRQLATLQNALRTLQ